MQNAVYRKLRLAERMRKLKLADEPADLTAATFFIGLAREIMTDENFIKAYRVNKDVVKQYTDFFKSMLDGFTGPYPGFAYSIEVAIAFLDVFGEFLNEVNLLTE